MKKQLKSLLLVALFACTALPAWSQASTEGKDFWVANTIVCQPPSAKSPAFPTIAVSAQKACTVTITDYAGKQLATANVDAGSWTRFGDNTAQIDPADYYLDPSKWYPTTNNVNATDVYNHADKINNYGLHITATENISVFVIMRTPEYSMDASNALPITALQSEYYLQDFQPNANGVDKPVTMTTILATENNTKVEITPKGNTYGKNNDGKPFTITLDKGQTYYLISNSGAQLAGTHIVAQGNKKIAVYVGSPVTRLPGGVAARDGLFEQMMPIDYWGTEFIATRSLQKDGNIIGITATTGNTEIIIDGYTQTFIDEGETYYVLLQGPADPYTKNLSKIECHIDQVITADAIYIETSCPAAVISYDTGNSFAGATASEIVNGQGDPSSVWLSPVQQKINKITFGACYTKKTRAHFLNIVTETPTCNNTKLTAYMGQYGNDWSNKLSWEQVPGNPLYSYARVQIGNDTEDINVFTLENSKGFIAHVYGNGEDESYAYSAGSAAVKFGIDLNGFNFEDGTMGVDIMGDEKFCVDNEIGFDFSYAARTRDIERVELNFGDGTDTVFFDVTDISDVIYHKYTSPTWYDVEVKLVFSTTDTRCNVVSLDYETSLKFSFPVVRPDTVPTDPTTKTLTLEEQKEIIETEGQEALDKMASEGVTKIINPDDPCYVTKKLSLELYCLETEEILDTIRGEDSVVGYNDSVYYASQDVVDITQNARGCNHYRKYHVEVITCLKMDVTNDSAAQHICPGETLNIPYEKIKGDIEGDAIFKVPGYPDQTITLDNSISNGTIELPISNIKSPGIYVGELLVPDKYCDNPKNKPFTINFAIYYPETIIKYKFNNTVAVYKKGFGGNTGYDFTDYQWFLNGDSIGTNASILYLGEGNKFHENDEIYVMLKDKSGRWLPSCPIIIEAEPEDYGGKSTDTQAPASKRIENRQIVIRIDNRSYNIYGQRVR